jgi:hypothetical protein
VPLVLPEGIIIENPTTPFLNDFLNDEVDEIDDGIVDEYLDNSAITQSPY